MNTFIKYMIWPILVGPAIYLAIVWNKLPRQVPLHYNFQGEVDRYGSKTELLGALAVLIGVNIGLYFLLTNINRVDPKKKYTEENISRMKKLAFAISIFMTATACFIIYTSEHAVEKLNFKIIVAAVGVLFVILGNYMYTIKPNYFAGIRLPWTLENEYNWKQTHMLAGKLWFAGGLLITFNAFLLPDSAVFIIMIVIIVILTIIPIVYSYRLYKKQNATGSH
ncbi:MAG TPA: SdpI family protein [Chitinophagaceae bacterium]